MIIQPASTALFPLTGMRRGQLRWGETAKRMLKLRRLRFGVDRAAKIHRIAHPYSGPCERDRPQQMSYQGTRVVVSASEPHLGGNIAEGDPFTFSPTVGDYLISRFAVNSVLDLGSGSGYAADYFFRRGLKVVAVDGLAENCRKAKFPTMCCDLTKTSVLCRVDLVHCQEVAEHIESAFVDNFLESLTCGKFIVMTHAVPGQGGHHHVNEQPASYWTEALGVRHALSCT
jgi:SAM-dependent methyltransferase